MPSDVPSDRTQNPLTPEVTWAQRSSSSDPSKNFIYLTIAAPDVPSKGMKLDIQSNSLTFEGYSNSKKAQYRVVLDFYSEIEPSESKINHSERDIEMKLQKKDLKEEYWPRLLRDSKKAHFLKTDFDKWVDEDEQNGAADDDYMNQFGMPGMGGMGADGGFGGLDFSKLGGGAGGMPDLGELDAGDGDSDEDLLDRDEEPADTNGSAGTEAPISAAKGSDSKIEEVE